ncbi:MULTISPECIES: hypothetical protein [Enterocloster]|uniref:Uncharacterized protein n=1 Tax=Enterocloster clostridioformis TaxID=1531 RepID=A0A227LC43_9FIRM|nr:hypothetical protein [Enterocloster clostridioformis]ANU48828.1 hypothetical protein A4V08_26510 [Lachnoclostridium sp. YL32]MDB2140722.1 hypothetical protein [Enterocloster clostridioformis]MDB2147709.1 hypothetical protein [Enterocloster clostridioformis]NDO32498.1 hypothetical protein [Enterocloster clostridioformis]OXE63970.1 hypothetical protein ADH76_27640 [Enterocloster clostridioformis]
MGKLHPMADKLLLEICKAYARTGSADMYVEDISSTEYDDCFYAELDRAGYITFHNTVAPNVEVLDRTIAFAKSQKLI